MAGACGGFRMTMGARQADIAGFWALAIFYGCAVCLASPEKTSWLMALDRWGRDH